MLEDDTLFEGEWSQKGETLILNGTARFKDGRILEGKFEDQQIVETGICTYPNGYILLMRSSFTYLIND